MAVEASLDALRSLVGAQSTKDDALLAWAVEAAEGRIRPRVGSNWHESAVQYAVLLDANRLYRRRVSATGVEGFGPEGFAVRVLPLDSDVAKLIEPYLDMCNAGIS